MIKQNLVPSSKYSIKCPHSMTPIGICVHNTANDASAKNEISYMVSNNLQTSFHFAVDDIEIWQGLPLDRNGWHAGDGNGDGNRKHIGIEICYSKSGGERFTKAEDRSAGLIANLLKERGWGIDRVKKHQDFSGKYCPHRTLDMGWARFINIIKSKMESPMNELLAYLGVLNEVEARTRLKEHLGEFNGKCDWGNENEPRGGHLGSERRKTKSQTKTIQDLQTTVRDLEAEVVRLEKALANPITPPNESRFGIETGTKVQFDRDDTILGYEKTYKPSE